MTSTNSGTSFFSVPPSAPCQFQLPKQLPYFTSRLTSTCPTTKRLLLHPIPLPRCSSLSSTSTPVVEQVEGGSGSPPPTVDDNGTGSQSDSSVPIQNSDPLTPPRGCKACGREEIEKGCNGKGRIQGGIATVPGFGWWPIKAYRPCPLFLASGGRYRRVGQSMDEVASGGYNRAGRGEKGVPMATENDIKTRKKKQGPLKFKR